jgi:hypothetical protein
VPCSIPLHLTGTQTKNTNMKFAALIVGGLMLAAPPPGQQKRRNG